MTVTALKMTVTAQAFLALSALLLTVTAVPTGTPERKAALKNVFCEKVFEIKLQKLQKISKVV